MSIANADDLDWRADAACREHNPDIFFPAKGPNELVDLNIAKKVCAGCPVRNACLKDAFANHDYHGVRAGITGRQRQRSGRAA